nr:MAG TPA: hypothetical protein [Caudoviricetes sp.]
MLLFSSRKQGGQYERVRFHLYGFGYRPYYLGAFYYVKGKQ